MSVRNFFFVTISELPQKTLHTKHLIVKCSELSQKISRFDALKPLIFNETGVKSSEVGPFQTLAAEFEIVFFVSDSQANFAFPSFLTHFACFLNRFKHLTSSEISHFL